MKPLLFLLAIASCVFMIVSCGGKDKKSADPGSTMPGDNADTAQIAKNNTAPAEVVDSTLTSVRSFIEKDLGAWARSFKKFNIDSFHMYQTSKFEDLDYGESETDMKQFYDLYNASLIYSSDSSHFIDLFSTDIFLEKKGKDHCQCRCRPGNNAL